MAKKNTTLHVNLNNQCNNSCIFCMEDKAGQMYIPSIKKTYTLFKKTKKKTDAILFTGPEPTANKDLKKYIRIAKDLDYKTIRLITNGRLLSYYNYARDLLESGLTQVSVSIHGSKASIHDALTRTPNSFKETLSACKNLAILKSIYPFQWNVNFTLTAINAKDLYSFLKLVSTFKKVDMIIINAVIPQGRGRRFFNQLITSYEILADSFKAAIKLIETESRQSIIIPRINLLGLPLCLLKGYEDYLFEYETILMNSRKRSLKIKQGRRYPRLKSKFCESCKYFPACPGIWNSYLQQRGWSEFKPVG